VKWKDELESIFRYLSDEVFVLDHPEFVKLSVVKRGGANDDLEDYKEHGVKTGSMFDPGAAVGGQSQLITDDFVESLMELGSFFMPPTIIATPVDYINDWRKARALQTNIFLAEICSQQILECENRLSVTFSGVILEGFKQPREFTFFFSHNYSRAKIFPDRNTLQTFQLSEFLRFEYPEISLVITDTLFSLQFADFTSSKKGPKSFLNGNGYLLFGDEHH